jgi:hypothetical protein
MESIEIPSHYRQNDGTLLLSVNFQNIHLKKKIMKTINVTRVFVIALIFGFISIFTVNAAGPAAVTAKNIKQKFAEVILNSEDQENVPASGVVVVLFTVTDDGKIDIKKLESTNDEAENFVKNKITNIPCKDFIYPNNQLYKVKFRFDKN